MQGSSRWAISYYQCTVASEHSVSYFFGDTLYLKIVTSAKTTLMGNFLAMGKDDSKGTICFSIYENLI